MMQPVKQMIFYPALVGQIERGVIDPLINSEPVSLAVTGFALPTFIDPNDGMAVRGGFDIVSIKIARETEFVMGNEASVLAPVGMELHWRECPQVVQWADEQVNREEI